MKMFTVAQSLADCLSTELKRPRTADPDVPGWKGEACVHPGGSVAYEPCFEGGGQAWVVSLGGFPTIQFPDPVRGGVFPACRQGHTFAHRYEIGVTRCVRTMDDDGRAPSCAEKEQEALDVTGDLYALLRSIDCCFSELDDEQEWRLLDYRFTGPEGFCAGSVATVVVNVPAPCCPGV